MKQLLLSRFLYWNSRQEKEMNVCSPVIRHLYFDQIIDSRFFSDFSPQ